VLARFASSVVSVEVAAAAMSVVAVVGTADANVVSIAMVVRGTFADSVKLGKMLMTSSNSAPVGRAIP
jgi:hypothetical protein